MTVRVVLASVIFVIGIAAATAETVNTPACKNDLAATWARMEEMLARLKSVARAGQDVKCCFAETNGSAAALKGGDGAPVREGIS